MPEAYIPGTLRLVFHWVFAVAFLLGIVLNVAVIFLSADDYWGEVPHSWKRKLYITVCFITLSPCLYALYVVLWMAGLLSHGVWPMQNALGIGLLFITLGAAGWIFLALPVWIIAKIFRGFGEQPMRSLPRSVAAYMLAPVLFFFSAVVASLTIPWAAYPARLLSGEAVMQASQGPAGLFFDGVVQNFSIFITPPNYNEARIEGQELSLNPREMHMFFVYLSPDEKTEFLRELLGLD